MKLRPGYKLKASILREVPEWWTRVMTDAFTVIAATLSGRQEDFQEEEIY